MRRQESRREAHASRAEERHAPLLANGSSTARHTSPTRMSPLRTVRRFGDSPSGKHSKMAAQPREMPIPHDKSWSRCGFSPPPGA
eukprot:3257735-Prymnesium_polylepis.5